MGAKHNKVSFIRLLNGDDIIAEVVNKSKTKCVLKNPMLVLNNIELEEGRQTLILYPWIPQGISLGNSAEIRIVNILMINEIEPEILDYYNGIIEVAFATKPQVVSSTATKSSEIGQNILSFANAVLKNKKEIN